MDEIQIPSIHIFDIDMRKCYFNPGCALNIYKPESGQKILNMLGKYFGSVQLHNICCHHNPQLPHGATIINNCAGCKKSVPPRCLVRMLRSIVFPALNP